MEKSRNDTEQRGKKIFHVDDTSLFNKCTPDKTFTFKDQKAMKVN